MDTETGFATAARQIEEERRRAAGTPPPKPGRAKAEPAERPNTTTAQARTLIDRIIRLEEEKRDTSEGIKDIYTEAKSAGFDPKAIRVLVKREMETAEQRASRLSVEETVALLEVALGAFAGTPLGTAAMDGARGHA